MIEYDKGAGVSVLTKSVWKKSVDSDSCCTLDDGVFAEVSVLVQMGWIFRLKSGAELPPRNLCLTRLTQASSDLEVYL
ncbi:hypothetical protein GJ496_009979 [Pomphorhynchus laevis]|nr:hypothetical protein GJ496_009979 [Pomphorhynchus laevis]